MIEFNIKPEEESEIIEFLSNVDYFSHLNKKLLKEMLKLMTFVIIEGGNTLINYGDLDTTLYILYRGRLRVLTPNQDFPQEKATVFEILSGQVVGEISFLLEKPRTATVQAVRDSLLLKCTKENFHKFEQNKPYGVINIAYSCIERLLTSKRVKALGENFRVLTVVPGGNSDHRQFSAYLYEELAKNSLTMIVDKNFCNNHFGRDIAQAPEGTDDSILISQWLSSLENQYQFIIYVVENTLTPWTKRCLRQADRIEIAIDDTSTPELNEIENEILNGKLSVLPFLEVVFIHSNFPRSKIDVKKFLIDRKTKNFFNLRLNVKADLQRYIRVLTGNSLGVVLNGGGARGFTHIGVLKALDELKIKIDFIGGTSIGALLGLSYALFGHSDGIYNIATELVDGFRKDYTFPIESILKGDYCNKTIERILGKVNIEELWLRFFCVSTNLSKNSLHIHIKGSAALACKATIALPGIFPPINLDGDVLIDGGVINNMPVDVMRELMAGGKILAVNCHQTQGSDVESMIYKKAPKLRQILYNRLIRGNPISYNSIDKLLVSAFNVASLEHQSKMIKETDYYLEVNTENYSILDSRKAYELIEIGYREAMKKLPLIFKLN
jgi:predicted acylesterase/phospholipase RssA